MNTEICVKIFSCFYRNLKKEVWESTFFYLSICPFVVYDILYHVTFQYQYGQLFPSPHMYISILCISLNKQNKDHQELAKLVYSDSLQ
jgi:hypothetical protein